jgi:hypothetical protein
MRDEKKRSLLFISHLYLGKRLQEIMKTLGPLIFALMLMFGAASAQNIKNSGPANASANAPDHTAANEMAKLAFQAHGGEKLKAVRSLVVRGSVDMTTSAFTQTFPGGFSMVISGEKYVLDLQSVQPFKQSFDGTNTYCSIRGIKLPPITSLGLPLLQKFGQAGYAIGALSPAAKKKRGFRMTAPDGNYTDFFVDEKTNQISGYESAFEVNGNSITTSAVVDKYRLVDGVLLPEKYSQRFDLGQFTAYANFKAKEIEINREIEDSVFSAPK